MKTRSTFLFIVTAVFMLPVFLKAQWNHSLTDPYNTFHKVFAVTANDVFVYGTSYAAGEYFLRRTSDGGMNWDSIHINTADAYQLNEIYFKDPLNGFIGGVKNNTNQVLLKTVDNGTTWTEITPDPASTEYITAIYFLTPLAGFAASPTMLYTTTNGGATWTSQPTLFAVNHIHFTDMNNGTASVTTATNAAAMMKTADGGATWSMLFNTSDPNNFVNSFSKHDVIGSSVMYTSLDYTNKLFRTVDAGVTWDTIVVDSVWTIQDYQFTTPLLGHVLSSQGQLFVTEDGGLTWALEYATEWGFYGPSVYFYSISFVEETGYVVGTSGLIKKHEAPSSIGEHGNSAGILSLYPNPLSGRQDLFIQTEESADDCIINIVNAIGQTVFNKTIAKTQTGSLITLSGLNLPAGVYSVSVETKENRSTEKLLIVE